MDNDIWNEINTWIGSCVTEFDEVLKEVLVDKSTLENQIAAAESKIRDAENERKENDKKDALSILDDYFFSHKKSNKESDKRSPLSMLDDLIPQKSDTLDRTGYGYADARTDEMKKRDAEEATRLQQAVTEKFANKPQTPGHKVLTDEQVLLIDKTRDLETSFAALVDMTKAAGGDARRAAIAATDAEKAFMMLVRAITA